MRSTKTAILIWLPPLNCGWMNCMHRGESEGEAVYSALPHGEGTGHRCVESIAPGPHGPRPLMYIRNAFKFVSPEKSLHSRCQPMVSWQFYTTVVKASCCACHRSNTHSYTGNVLYIYIYIYIYVYIYIL